MSEVNDDSANRTGQYLVYFAAERTLMAWIRVSLGLMALGFVIDRFGLVLRTMAPQSGKIIQSSTLSFVAGAGLVVMGSLMAILAAARHTHYAWHYRRTGAIEPAYGLGPAIFFTVAIALAGAVIAAYLMTVAR